MDAQFKITTPEIVKEFNDYFDAIQFIENLPADINAVYYEYYDTGELREKTVYKNGKREGEFLYYYKNGQLLGKCYYKNDKLHGEYLYYFSNGQIKEKSYWENGIKIN